VESVQAYIATLARNIRSKTQLRSACAGVSGALGSVNVTMLAYPKNFEGSVTILGETGTVAWAAWL